MAAEQGGNCELTEPGQAVVKHGVTIVGYTDLASRLAKQSSTLYSTNLLRLTEELCKTKDGVVNVNMEDEAIRGLTVIKEGSITWPPPPPKLPAVAPRQAGRGAGRRAEGARPRAAASRCRRKSLAMVFGVRRAGLPARRPLRAGQLPRPLHRVRAGLLRRLHGDLERDAGAAHAADERDQRDLVDHRHRRADPDRAAARGGADRAADELILRLAVFALALTAINMFGGFAVTRRMLAMFRK